MDQPVGVDEGDVLVDLGVAHARGTQRDAQQAGDADARGTGAHDDHAGLLEASGPRLAAPRAHRARTTAAVPWMSSLNDGRRPRYRSRSAQRVVLLEVLELDETAGPDLLHAGDERLHQLVVRLAPKPRAADTRGRAGRPAAPGCRCRRRARPAASGSDGCRTPPCRGPACRWGWPCRRHPGRRGPGCARCP